MSLATGRTKLVTSLKALHARWSHVRTGWDDRVRAEFEAEFIEPLEGKVRSGANAMETMNELLARARHDCQ